MMADYCTACERLKEYAANVIINGITEKECQSLQKDTGLNPDLAVLHTNCEDLKDLNDCLIGALNDTLGNQSVCDWKEFMDQLMKNVALMNKALVCSDCGQWLKIHELEESINKLWKKMAKIEAAIDALAAQNWEVDAKYTISYATPGMSVFIDRSTGNFKFVWSDWLNDKYDTLLGVGSVTGKVHFGMGQESGLAAKWQIRSVTIDNCHYQSKGVSGVNQFRINLYVKNDRETRIFEKTHDTTQTVTWPINQTVPIGMKGVLAPGDTTGWIQFLEVFNDSLSTPLDDRANVQVKFANNNKLPVAPYI